MIGALWALVLLIYVLAKTVIETRKKNRQDGV